jgi:hypothetical protein
LGLSFASISSIARRTISAFQRREARLLGEVFGEGSVREAVDALIVFAIESQVGAGGVDQLVDRRLRDWRAGDGGGQRGPDAVTDGSSAALRDR